MSSPGPLSSITASTSDPKRFFRSRKDRAGDILDTNVPLLGQRHSSPPRRKPRGKERFSLPRSERSGYTRDSDAPLVGQHPKDQPPAPSSTGLQYSPSTAHWIGGGVTKGQVLTGPFEKRKKNTMSKASAERDSKRRKLDHKVQSKLENLGSKLMSYINEYTNTKDRALCLQLAPHIDLATQFLNTLTPRFENPGSNDTEEKMVDFFETAVRILDLTASFREGVISDQTIPVMTELLQKILTAIGDLDVDTSDEHILSPSADMAILLLESVFQKLEQENEDKGLYAICGICSLVLDPLITKLIMGHDQRDMVSVIKLSLQLLKEINAELCESNADSHLGHLLAIGTSITVKLQEKVDGVRDCEEDDETWLFNTTTRILVLSIERMMSGLKDGTAEAKVNRRWYHVSHLLELAEDSPLCKLSEVGCEGLVIALIQMTKKIFGPSNELLEQVIVLLESLAPLFELYGSTLGKIQIELRASPQLLTYLLDMSAVIYNEVILELRQSGAEFITLANTVSDFTKICSLFLACIASGASEHLPPNQAKLDSFRVLANFLESLSAMHRPSDEKSATSKAEDDDGFEQPTLKRSDSLRSFYRSYSDLQKMDEEAFETKGWEAETEQSHFDRLESLLNFIEGQSIQTTADDGGVIEWKFDPDQSALHRVQEILGFMRSQTDSSLNSSIVKLDEIPEHKDESSEEASDENDDE
ncbi:hypothetical protein N7481_006072 [Penicillium waksmanii]|uniref:uncharacterized protein n=1 Tax=Penicillium waksmanii TaxID=69791 RepID=UPI0025494817|nr:uncharacterized protein N7481_006072 [Penicillium waksmanii]KAJ5983973.1 hypothetical protein N7481_006072 [Penicillium waksmanii]